MCRAGLLCRIANRAWALLNSDAKRRRRGYEVDLTEAKFLEVTEKPCSYSIGDVLFGVDRVDITLGYSVENCVSVAAGHATAPRAS